MSFKARVSTYEHGIKVWSIKKDEVDWRTVLFTRDDNYEGPSIVTFYIDHEYTQAVIINNLEWELLCFDLEYTPQYILKRCLDHLKWVVESKKLLKVEDFTFPDYDALMQRCA